MRKEKSFNTSNIGTTDPTDITDRAIKQAVAAVRAGKHVAKDDESKINELHLISYTITSEPLTEGSPPETPELAARYEELHPGQHEPEQWPGLLSELESLHNKYPDDAKIANYLAALYSFMDRDADRDRISEDLHRRYPDYLFAIIAMVTINLNRNEVEKAKAILNKRFELSIMCPDRKVFHISEFVAFYNMIVRYHIACGNVHGAQCTLDVFKSVAPDHPNIAPLENLLMFHSMKTQWDNLFTKSARTKRASKRK